MLVLFFPYLILGPDGDNSFAIVILFAFVKVLFIATLISI